MGAGAAVPWVELERRAGGLRSMVVHGFWGRMWQAEELGDGLVQVSCDYTIREDYLNHQASQSLAAHSYLAHLPVQLQIPSG